MLGERVRQFQPECFRDSIVICNKGQVIIRRKTKKSQVQFFSYYLCLLYTLSSCKVIQQDD